MTNNSSVNKNIHERSHSERPTAHLSMNGECKHVTNNTLHEKSSSVFFNYSACIVKSYVIHTSIHRFASSKIIILMQARRFVAICEEDDAFRAKVLGNLLT